MFRLIFAIIIAIVLCVKYYEIIRYKEKVDTKNWIYLMLVTVFVFTVLLEKLGLIE